MKILIGQKAPSFALPDQEGTMHSLADLKGKWVLLYFYPKDNTPGCTIEACGIRDSFPDFQKVKAVVLGVSADPPQSHARFIEKYNLPFTLLSDEKHETLQAYGVWGKKKFMGRSYDGISRTSFLIDPEGKIAKIYEEVKPAGHAEEVLQDLKTLKV
ncbi:thioredoxin-dependent thiol peroxidase [Patescibacteria group bacterium]|nr:thioredoxin-dependent thiol peroxidase [Patescibacteria group bacterium]